MSSNSSSNEASAILHCCFKKCVQNPTRIIEKSGSRADVRAYEPKSKKEVKVVDWQDGGSATFHKACWEVLIAATKGVRTAQHVELSDIERSMVLEASKTVEYHDSDVTVAKEAAHIANLLKKSSYCIGFTGAGISTAAGIGDFRGIHGKWTEQAKVKNYGKTAQKAQRNYSLESLRPTYTHEALLKLMELGILKFLISQNTDGLHRLSGIPPQKLSELHGNAFIERCEDCGIRYERTSSCRSRAANVPPKPCPRCKINHRTGRKCTAEGCNGYLMNTIINFGDYLESDIIGSAQRHAEYADLVLVLGSTLRVSPANDLVTMGQSPNRLIICNRQTTPYDDCCEETGPDGKKLGSRVHGDCDRLMREVMKYFLPPEDLEAWERDRQARMAQYSSKRTPVA